MQIIPYLGFDGNCREAMEFYKEALGGSVEFMPFGDSPMEGTTPEMKEKIMHSVLMLDEKMVLMAADMGGEDKRGESKVSICIICTSKEEIERFFDKLSEGGKVGHPLKDEFFGIFGDLTDKYGFRWMFQFDNGKKV